MYGILRNIDDTFIQTFMEKRMYLQNSCVWSASPTPVCEVSHSQAQLEMTSGNALGKG